MCFILLDLWQVAGYNTCNHAGVTKASCALALQGLHKGLFLCKGKAGGGAWLAVPGYQIRVSSFQSLTVQPGRNDRVPCGFPAVALKDFCSLVHHLQLDSVLDGLHPGVSFLYDGLQLPKRLDLEISSLNAHCVYLLRFCLLSLRAASASLCLV